MDVTDLTTLALQVWWEPGTKGALDIGDFSVFLTVTSTIVGIVIAMTKWWSRLLRRIVREEIGIATEPIHPESNGGLSLADVARRTARLEDSIEDMRQTQSETKDLLLRVLAHSMGVPEDAPRSRAKKI